MTRSNNNEYIPSPSAIDWYEQMSGSYPTGYLVRPDGWHLDWDAFAERVSAHLLKEFGVESIDQATEEQCNTAERCILITAARDIERNETWRWHGALFFSRLHPERSQTTENVHEGSES